MHVAIMKITAQGRVAKYADFEDEAEAQAHVARFAEAYPDAYVVAKPVDHPVVDWFIVKPRGPIVIKPVSRPSKKPNKADRALRVVAARMGPEVLQEIDAILASED